MNYGLYLSASGALTATHRQDVVANNLANAETSGFKRQLAMFMQRKPEVYENGSLMEDGQALLDRMGGGVFAQRSVYSFEQGPLKETENDLDMAIEGHGFFALRAADGQIQFSRDGRMTLNQQGVLINQATSLPVLDTSDQPIVLDANKGTEIDTLGNIKQDGKVVGQIQVSDLVDRDELQPMGQGLYELNEAQLKARQTANAQLRSGWLERSNVDPIREMVAMIEATRAMEQNANLIKYHDMTMDKAINRFGQVT